LGQGARDLAEERWAAWFWCRIAGHVVSRSSAQPVDAPPDPAIWTGHLAAVASGPRGWRTAARLARALQLPHLEPQVLLASGTDRRRALGPGEGKVRSTVNRRSAAALREVWPRARGAKTRPPLRLRRDLALGFDCRLIERRRAPGNGPTRPP
jgi:hypothetical protein